MVPGSTPKDVEEDHVLEIAQWLMNQVISYGYDNNAEAVEYATRIIQFGAHSVQMIIDCVQPDDVNGFRWMKPLHRRMLKKWLSTHQGV